MIHLAQCLCGPERHAIYAMLYDDLTTDTETVMTCLPMMIESMIEGHQIRRRCEICDKDVEAFVFEDNVTKEQDWDKVREEVKRSEAEQALSRLIVQAARRTNAQG